MLKNAYIRKQLKKKDDIVNISFDGIAMKYLEGLEKRRYSRNSIEAYYTHIKHFYYFLEAENITALQDVSTKTLEKYIRTLFESSFSSWSIDSYIRTVKALFCYLENEGVVFDNPGYRLVNPKINKRMLPAPSESDIKKLLAEVKTDTADGVRTRAMIETAYSCGLRVGELVSMDITSVDFRHAIARIKGKGRKERVLPVGREAIYWIKHYLASARDKLLGGNIDEKALWISRAKRRIEVQTFELILRKLTNSAGLESGITPHSLRRACATHMLRNGAHPTAIQHLLGHSTMRTLSHYLRMTITDLKKTHEQSRLSK